MKRRTVTVRAERFELREPFVIARGVRTHAEVVRISITEDSVTGQGEATPLARYGETPSSTVEAIEAQAARIARGLGRAELQELMAPGAARNAVDLALWDLEAKLRGVSVWALAGIEPPDTIESAYTLSLDTPAAMAGAARVHAARPLIKLKLAGDGADGERIAAVRAALPAARLIADANESLDAGSIRDVLAAGARHGLELIEQPLPAGNDAGLAEIERTVPVCADEACHTRRDLDAIAGRYDAVNVKLDKAGGLTEALALAGEARGRGLMVMVGCMVSTSLAIAPAQLVAAGADFVDLDSPLYLVADRHHAIRYDVSAMAIAGPKLWG